MSENNIQLKARADYLKRFYESNKNISIEEIQREGLRANLEQFIKSAERFYDGTNVHNKGLFFRLGINILNKKHRIKLAEMQLAAAEGYIKEAESEKYSNLPEFEDLINSYYTLSKK